MFGRLEEGAVTSDFLSSFWQGRMISELFPGVPVNSNLLVLVQVKVAAMLSGNVTVGARLFS